MMMTPPPMRKEKTKFSAAEKQTLLDNFDLEGMFVCLHVGRMEAVLPTHTF